MSIIPNNQFVLNLAINGVIPTKSITPHVPITPEEVVKDLDACFIKNDITYIHLHARDENEINSSDPKTYSKFIEAVKNKYPDLPICVSSSGRIDPSFKSRSRVLDLKGDLKPQMASLTLSSLNFAKSASINEPETIVQLAKKMEDNGIKPEIEIFDVGMMNYANYLIQKNILKPPYYFNIILGNIFSAQAKASHFSSILNELPENSIWSMGGIGDAQTPSTLLSLSQGGGIRTGLEDNIWYDGKRTILARNVDLISRVNQIAELCNKQILPQAEFKKILSLS
ncbi:MAG: 3-keto-5-aminohexanoate cleavage protein [Akkermansiaceae bacterium]